MISFKNVKLNINNKTIVKNFNVDIKQYSKSVFLGEKKSGKTTFFKILTRCYKPTNGNIYIDGTDINIYNINKNISIIYDKRESKMSLNVNEYLRFFGNIKGIDDKSLKERIEHYLKKYDLYTYKYDDIDNLTIFEYKILCLIKSLLNNPKIMLFDEFFKYLSLTEINNIKKIIFEEDVDNKTIIFTSNKLDNFLDVCDYTGIIANQQIIDYNTIENILKLTENGRRIEMVVKNDTSVVKELLLKRGEIFNISSIDNKFIFSIKNDVVNESDILEFLITNGVKIISFNKIDYNFDEIISEIQFKKEINEK